MRRITRAPHRTRRLTIAAAALTVLAATACDPVATSRPPLTELHRNGLRITSLTYEGSNSYRYARPSATAVDVTAPSTNRGGNHRVAITDEATPPSIDQEACVSWHGPRDEASQPGVVLRVQSDPGRARAIMVTNNIMYGIRSGINVHLVDSANPGNPLTMLGGGFYETVGGDATRHPLPWRFCARAIGDRVIAKGWSTALPEPSWEDERATLNLTLPASHVHAGRPGVYAGHVLPGRTSRFRGIATTELHGGPGEARWNDLRAWAALLHGRMAALDGSITIDTGDARVVATAASASRSPATIAALEAALGPDGRRSAGRHVFGRMLGRTGGGALTGSAADRAAVLSASAEFNRGIGNDTEFVTRLYERILGRSPDPGGLQHWVAQIPRTSRAAVTKSIWNSAGHRDRIATELLTALHGTTPSPEARQRAATLVTANRHDAARAMAAIIADTAP